VRRLGPKQHSCATGAQEHIKFVCKLPAATFGPAGTLAAARQVVPSRTSPQLWRANAGVQQPQNSRTGTFVRACG
jgi:hypothetical protein